MEIENISLADIVSGNHVNSGNNTILIRILDSDNYSPPLPAMSFLKVHEFRFMDADEDSPLDPKFKFSRKLAIDMVNILRESLANKHNVVVHCTAGICRSGAITEIASMMGFDAIHDHRIPNSFVKKLMMRELGWSYSTNDLDH